MGALGQHPIQTAGHPSRVAAVREYDACWPEAPALEVAWMLGCAVRDVWLARYQEREREQPPKPLGWRRKTRSEVTQGVRARRLKKGLCQICGDVPRSTCERTGKLLKSCAGCREDTRERVASYRLGEGGKAAS